MVCATSAGAYGQLGFCTGSTGIPIFFEDFGSGFTFGPPLPAGVSTYNFVPYTPNDGDYTLYYLTGPNSSWHNVPDHTPDDVSNGTNGKSLIVNAGLTAGEFYRRTVSNLCVNTTFEFTAWLMNVFNASSGVCTGTGIPIDVKFEIWDATETTLLKSGSTGAIQGTSTPQWTQYGLTFTTLPGQTSVVLKMINNGVGGCGNDLAIDDIMFRSCGDLTTISSSVGAGTTFTTCDDNAPVNMTLSVAVASGNPHVFQWQESNDNIIWSNIVGENSTTFTASNITTTKYYRVKVAQDAANLANNFCLTVTDPFSIIIIPKPLPPVSPGNQANCGDQSVRSITVAVPNGVSVDWFDAPTGGNLVAGNILTFTPTAPGTWYAEAFVPNANCRSGTRTAISWTIHPQPVVTDEPDVAICEGGEAQLDAGLPNMTYDWQPDSQNTQSITVFAPGTYSVTVTNANNCSSVKTFTVVQKFAPEISSVSNSGSTVTINTTVSGDFEYSLDGINYQASNIFYGVGGGMITAYVREVHECGEDSEDYLLILMPLFITPNGDGANDHFSVPGFQFMGNSKIAVFDRYGKLLTIIHHGNPTWDGTINGYQLPASDYWYRATFDDGTEQKGHFSIIR
ncbi:MAG TPA: T9SS type B sorting domain-containing protein [Flavobacterium sp.]|jgi:gliding motility-associated-like protein|nr:T9SS type B sorting domain-containing protein [Flavobacterium sp.]